MTTPRKNALALALLAGAALISVPLLGAEVNGSAAGRALTGGVAGPMISIAPRNRNVEVFTGPNGTDMQVGRHARGSAIPAPTGSPGQAGQ